MLSKRIRQSVVCWILFGASLSFAADPKLEQQKEQLFAERWQQLREDVASGDVSENRLRLAANVLALFLVDSMEGQWGNQDKVNRFINLVADLSTLTPAGLNGSTRLVNVQNHVKTLNQKILQDLFEDATAAERNRLQVEHMLTGILSSLYADYFTSDVKKSLLGKDILKLLKYEMAQGRVALADLIPRIQEKTTEKKFQGGKHSWTLFWRNVVGTLEKQTGLQAESIEILKEMNRRNVSQVVTELVLSGPHERAEKVPGGQIPLAVEKLLKTFVQAQEPQYRQLFDMNLAVENTLTAMMRENNGLARSLMQQIAFHVGLVDNNPMQSQQLFAEITDSAAKARNSASEIQKMEMVSAVIRKYFQYLQMKQEIMNRDFLEKLTRQLLSTTPIMSCERVLN